MQQPDGQGPLQRHPTLQPLSRAHHDLLMGCLLMEKGIRQKVDHQRITAFVRWFLAGTVLPHLRLEMAWLEQFAAADDPIWQQGLQQEKGCLERLSVDPSLIDPVTLIQELRRHVRFQERSFFTHFQQHYQDQLGTSASLPDATGSCIAGWSDTFWVTASP